MNSGSRYVLGLVLAAFLVSSLSCARDQQLVSITIQPNAEVFGGPDPGLNVQLRALGTYIHPPVTKDITGEVTWISNTPDLATVTSTGLLAPAGIDVCGGGLVSATLLTNKSAGDRSSSGAVVTGTMNVTVNNTAVIGCPGFAGGTQPILTVAFLGTGAGTVVSVPSGIDCTAACSAGFANGAQVVLTATPNGTSTFGSWVGCDTVAAQVCTVTLSTNRTVTVTFN